MDKSKFNPTIAFTVVAVLIFIIVLVLVLRSGSDEPETAGQPDTQQPVEQPDADPAPDPEPDPAPTPDPDPAPDPQPDPEPTPDPEPPTGVLPDDWDQLTSAQKTERNPFDCDHESQWVSAEDGSCLDKLAEQPHNGINLDLIQEGSDLLAVHDGRPYDGRVEIDISGVTYDRVPWITGIRVDSAADCHPGMEVPPRGSYDRVPYASQHWTVDYLFRVGRYDIGHYICAWAKFHDSDRIHTQAVKVDDFYVSEVGVRFARFSTGWLTVYTDNYLPAGIPAWEYIGPKEQVADFDENNCGPQTFITYEDEIVSETFVSPQHFFQTSGNGFAFHDSGDTAELVIHLTEADIGKMICFRVRNSFDQVEYVRYVIDSIEALYVIT